MCSINSTINEKQFESTLSSCAELTQNCVNSSTTNNSDVIDVRVGSRKSKLALIQTEHVVRLLSEIYGQSRFNFTIKSMSTTGDNILNKPLSKIGEKALFTRELEDELLANKIDFIVHSLKDLPTSLPNGCTIAVITKREDSSDAIVLKSGLQLADPLDVILKPSTKSLTIGTSSLRRIAQLKQLNPEITIADMRGNINTRLAKLDQKNSTYSALILASAGLKRGGFSDRISKRLCADTTLDWYYAVGQGALAIETRAGDQFILDLLKPLIDLKTTYECLAERTFMQELEGGCSVPIGVRSTWNRDPDDDGVGGRDYSDSDSRLTLSGIVLSLDGKSKVENRITIDLNEHIHDRLEKAVISRDSSACPFNYTEIAINQMTDDSVTNKLKNSAILGFQVAQSLLKVGAKDILNNIKNN